MKNLSVLFINGDCFVCIGAKKERRLKKSVSQEVILPHCLQKPTRLADGLGLGGVLPLLLQGCAPLNGFPASACADFGYCFFGLLMFGALFFTLSWETLSRIILISDIWFWFICFLFKTIIVACFQFYRYGLFLSAVGQRYLKYVSASRLNPGKAPAITQSSTQ